MSPRLPTYFVSHGGGPWPWMKDQYGPTYARLEDSLVDIKRQIGARPKAVLVVTAHWETEDFAVSSGTAPGMIYDYGGFPRTPTRSSTRPGRPATGRARGATAERRRPAGQPRRRTRLRPRHLLDAGADLSGRRVPVVQLSIRRATTRPPTWPPAARWRRCATRAC
jgi:hypothetical protein